MHQRFTALLPSALGQRPLRFQSRFLLFFGSRYCAPPGEAQDWQGVLQRDVIRRLESVQRRFTLIAGRQFLATSRIRENGKRWILKLFGTVKRRVDSGKAIRLLTTQALHSGPDQQRHVLSRQIAGLPGNHQRLLNGWARNAQVGIATESNEAWGTALRQVEGALCDHALHARQIQLVDARHPMLGVGLRAGHYLLQPARWVTGPAMEESGEQGQRPGAQRVTWRTREKPARSIDRRPGSGIGLHGVQADAADRERIDHEGGVGGVILVSQQSQERSRGSEIVSAGFVISPRTGERASELQELGAHSQVGERIGKIERRFDDRLGGIRLAKVQVDQSQRIAHLQSLMGRLWTIQARKRVVTRLQTSGVLVDVGE
jgi:hypothetical protein